MPLHVAALAGRDRLPEQLERRGREPAGDGQAGRVVHLPGRQLLQLAGAHDQRVRHRGAPVRGDPAEEVLHREAVP
jgi:hypothetical protein